MSLIETLLYVAVGVVAYFSAEFLLIKLAIESDTVQEFIQSILVHVYIAIAVVALSHLLYGPQAVLVISFYTAMFVRVLMIDLETTFTEVKKIRME